MGAEAFGKLPCIELDGGVIIPATIEDYEGVRSVSTATTPQSLADISPKMEFQAKVKRVELAGAVIDLGAGIEGFLHISQIKGKKVRNVQDALSEGQEVTVWVSAVDQASGKVSLTMTKPAAVEWSEISQGQV